MCMCVDLRWCAEPVLGEGFFWGRLIGDPQAGGRAGVGHECMRFL